MKIGIFSDLHLDFYKNPYPVMHKIMEQAEGVDVLICAGDVANGMTGPIMAFRKYLAEKFNYVEVFGNHDFYGEADWMLPGKSFTIDGLKFAVATLWTDCHNDFFAERWFKRAMADAECIPQFSIAKMKFLHQEHRNFIFDSKPDVVITHNPPSMMSVGPRFVGQDSSNKAFIPELGTEIAYSDIKLWVCGHVHHKHSYYINNTKIVCNPLGYPGEIYKNILDYNLEIVNV